MKKFLLSALAALSLCLAPSFSQAETIDVAEVECKEFLAMKEDEMSILIMWIDGYMSAQSGETQIDDAWMEKLGTHLGEYCAKNPNKTIMSAIKAMK